ncbi:MAG: cob(I)yrinic acid a,c-diamide adenosyltransferase [Actinomycetota bacterium]|nr:cob(I)yrinic acid a,c-diamide adenosyltransferase [Actinomycetota bacterium]
MRIYTRRGDSGTTSLRTGARVPKDSLAVEVNGAVDEAQAALGLARSECPPGGELDRTIQGVQRDLWILMSEVATEPGREGDLDPGRTAVTDAMVAALESRIDAVVATVELEREFSVPGAGRCSAALDLARTIVRRAERLAVSLAREGGLPEGSRVGPYLNRLSDLCWALARSAESERQLAVDVPSDAREKDVATRPGETPGRDEQERAER